MNFDELWEELRNENPELFAKVDQRIAEILSLEKPRGCPPDCYPGFCDDPDEEICDRCWASYEKRKTPITNYDRLKNMSMEDLAAMTKICRATAENLDECEKWRFPDGSPDCYSCALDWLKQEEQNDSP